MTAGVGGARNTISFRRAKRGPRLDVTAVPRRRSRARRHGSAPPVDRLVWSHGALQEARIPALVRRNAPDRGRESCIGRGIDRPVPDPGACRGSCRPSSSSKAGWVCKRSRRRSSGRRCPGHDGRSLRRTCIRSCRGAPRASPAAGSCCSVRRLGAVRACRSPWKSNAGPRAVYAAGFLAPSTARGPNGRSRYSAITAPEPPISLGTSSILGSPSLMRSFASW